MRRSTQRGCFWENTPSRIKNSITGCSAVGSAPALGVRMHSSMRLLANPATLSNTKRTRFSELFAIRIFSGNTTDLLLQFSISYSSPGVAQLVARVVWEDATESLYRIFRITETLDITRFLIYDIDKLCRKNHF